MGYKLRNKIRFGIGKEVDLNTFDLVQRMERIMCEDNCRLGGAEDKIREKLNLLILNCKNGL
jgi:hypothetical protein